MKEAIIYKKLSFEAAHRLPNIPGDHPCNKRLHGHSYRVTLGIHGPIDPHYGWVIDFADIKRAFAPLMEQLDHSYLNDVEGLDNPTCENLACWIWDRLKPELPGLCEIRIKETDTVSCVYYGDTAA
jgi:6-pyruvoyltetrahydropterin/6-carboxytetrahydropterin synthase